MVVFRWIVGVLAAFFAVGMTFSFVVGIAQNSEPPMRRARRLRHWLWLVMLLWFNVEVWGRVVIVIIHWI
ncbi:MAG: hypothetical protein ABI460_15860 [Caldimonas sp.]